MYPLRLQKTCLEGTRADNIEFSVFRGSDSVFLAWWHPTKIDNCLGYAVNRRVAGGVSTPLPAYEGFPSGQPPKSNPDSQPSSSWPFQRFTWTDFEPPPTGTVEYQVVAMVGTPKSLSASEVSSAWVAPVAPAFGDRTPFFNFGIVGSRWFATKALDYPVEFEDLRKALVPPHDGNENAAPPGAADRALETVLSLPLTKNGPASPTIGDELGGPLARRMKAMLDEVKADPSQEIYLALFELSDSELIEKLAQIGDRCHLILANGTHEKGVDENAGANQKLSGTQVRLSRRMIAKESVYAHNKFAVLVKNNQPQSVWTGSTNWSPHGLYTQVNNGLLVDDPDVAQAYWDEWKRLQNAGNVTPPPPLPPAQEQYHFDKGGVETSVFFSPHPRPKADGANSPDLKYAASLIRGARQGILTLMLDPGWQGSLLQDIREQAEADPSLYIRGVVNSDPTIHAQAGDATAVGFLHNAEAVPSNYDIVLPAAHRKAGDPIVDYLGRVGIVVVHSKIIVIDALGDHPVVMTGSHNAGVKAATINDDNLIIIENDRELAIAYAINAISVFNHFWWRHNTAPPSARKNAKAAVAPIAGPPHMTSDHEWTGLEPSDAWQAKFYAGAIEDSEARFWGVKS